MQLENMIESCNKVITSVIPELTQIVDFYKCCVANTQYFSDSEKGQRAKSIMFRAIESSKSVCKSLENIGSMFKKETENLNNKKEYYLLEILQDVFDDLVDAEVCYEDEYICSRYNVFLDKDQLEEHVLLNIRENIKNHAFGTQNFKKKHIWEKVVTIVINDSKDNYVVNIFNNGQPFKGDVSKVFDYGYCHGVKQHTGIGMYSAKKTMVEIGGDLSFSVINSRYNKTNNINEPCSVLHTLIIPKK